MVKDVGWAAGNAEASVGGWGAFPACACIPTACRERMLAGSPAGRSALESEGICLAGVSELVPPYEIARPNPPCHVVLLCLDGRGELAWPTRTALVPGSVCFLPKGCAHRYRSGPRWRMVWFHLRAEERWTRAFPDVVVIREAEWLSQLSSSAHGFLEELGVERADSPWVLESYAHLTARFLMRELTADIHPSERDLRRRLEVVWQRVRHAPEAPWSVAELASLACMSRPHLHAVVRRLHRTTVMDVVARLRMEQAAHLLSTTHWTLADIATRVGYGTAFSFSRAFKRVMGVSPQRYRSGV